MARSESQGLQIAVILFTMLTVGLSLSTYMYFQAFTTEYEKRKTAENTAKEANEKFDKQTYKVMSLQYVLGVGDVTKPQLEALKSRFGKDEQLDQAMDEFEKALAGHKVQSTETLAGIRSLPPYLLKEVEARNESLKSEKEEVVKVTAQKGEVEKKKEEEVAAAEVSRADAENKLNTKSQEFTNYLAEHKKKLDELKAELDRKTAEVAAEKKTFNEQVHRLTQTIANIEKERDKWRDKYMVDVERATLDNEAPDGEVTWINQRERLVWINLGSADGLVRQITFTVYDHDENGLSSRKEKARIEVLKIMEPHMAECRILQDNSKNPILPGDKLFTPAWSPGQRLHFALAGTIDIDGDGRSDREAVKNIITLNGGVVDAEQTEDGKRIGDITYETRYLIRGRVPSEKDFSGDAGKRAFQTYSEMVGGAEKKNVELIDVPSFLAKMGWKAQQKTFALGQKRMGNFEPKARTPLATAPAEAAKPAEPKEMEEKPADAGGDDPFK